MRVEVDRDRDLVLQRRDQRLRRRRLDQPAHILDGEDVGARGLEFLGQPHIIAQRIFRPVRVVDVAGITEGRLAETARLEHRIHGDPHVLDPIERIEDAEDIDPGLGGAVDEFLDHVVRIVGIADPVRGPDQHLGQQVRHGAPQVAQPLPGAFL